VLGCAALTAVFGYHTVYGRHGLEARRHLIQRSAELDREIKSLEAVRAEYTRHVRLLGKTPHQDMVEEIAQRDLGFAYPDTILLPR
jgi:cell division protein FtsB